MLDDYHLLTYTLARNGFGSVINDMTIYDMCFYFVEVVNSNSYNNYCENTSEEESKKRPFNYPYQTRKVMTGQ